MLKLRKSLGAGLLATYVLMHFTVVHAQDGESSDPVAVENSFPEDNLQEEAEPVRRVQRLGDVVGESEWELELSVPQAVGSLPNTTRLPNVQQQEQLQALLTQVATHPEDQGALMQLNSMLGNLVSEANSAIDANRQDVARSILDVVRAVNPSQPGINSAQDRLGLLGQEQGRLEAARVAMQAGRVDQPEDNSAWFFYRQVLDQNPTNEQARAGLLAVQQDMIARAVKFAQSRDFDSAERLLEDAAFVREDQALVEQAQAEVDAIKTSHAEELESQAVAAMDRGDFSEAERVLTSLIALGGMSDMVNQLRTRLEEARVYGGFKPGQVIRDHFLNKGLWAPESVIILAGSFLMGSLPSEQGRAENEGPQHRVTLTRGFAIGLREVSVGEFRAFVSNAGYRTTAEREGHSIAYDHYSGRLAEKDGVNWNHTYEGALAKSNDPVIHVSWNDAKAYVGWLASGTGKGYRLPTESEFEFALRGGRSTRYWWGDGTPATVLENLSGEKDVSRSRRHWSVAFAGYADKFWGPAPVGSFSPNPYGLFDIGGNAGEWVMDCWHDTYIRAPSDGEAWINPGCEQRVIRGGHWASSPDQARSAFRLFAKPNYHDARTGFRVAKDL
jgi:formylglycine-generating enzyme required for sulfatase activity